MIKLSFGFIKFSIKLSSRFPQRSESEFGFRGPLACPGKDLDLPNTEIENFLLVNAIRDATIFTFNQPRIRTFRFVNLNKIRKFV